MIPILHGAGFGLLFVFTFGPTFFTILQSSLSRGFKAGVLTVLGISLCDISYATIASLGLSNLLESETFKWRLGLVGGIMLLVFGVVSLFKKAKVQAVDEHLESGNLWKYFLKGLVVNGINPFVIIFWMSIIGMSSVKWGYVGADQKLFIIGMLSTILLTDLIKCFLAHRLRSIITPQRISILNKVIGAALIIFSVQLFYETFK